MGLRLGAAQYCYLLDYSLEESIKRLANRGFKYIELMSAPPHIWPPDFSEKQRETLRHLCDSLGVELIALNPGYLDLNLASPNPGIRKETVKQIKEQIDLAHDLGASIVVIMGGKRHSLLPPPFEVVWEEYAKKSIVECVEHAEKRKVIFGLENGPMRFLEKAYHLKQVAKEIDNPYLRIAFDTSNAKMVEPVVPAIDEIKEYLAFLHLSDSDGKTWTHSPIGTKQIDFSLVGKKLREIDFEGVSTIAMIHPQDPEGGLTSSKEKLLQWGWSL